MKANRKLTAVLVCIFASITLWFLIALSREYTTRVVLPVSYQNLPSRKVVTNNLPKNITLTVRTSGFNILAMDFGSRKEQLNIDVAALLEGASPGNNGGEAAVATAELSSEITRELGGDMTITAFSPDSISFSFGSRASRQVPVHANVTIAFEKQYDSIGIYSLMPHEVEISGPDSLIRGIDWIETEPAVVAGVKSDIKLKLKLKAHPYTELSSGDVMFFVPVEKFTEGSAEVEVHVANKGNFDLKSFPDKVRVRYLVPISKYAMVKPESFEVMVNAADAVHATDSKLRVSVTNQPVFVRSVSVEPERVEFIIRKK